MEYLKAAVTLKRFIKEMNQSLPLLLINEKERPQRIILKKRDKEEQILEMEDYSNDYVFNILSKEKDIEFIMICDRASIIENGKEMHYYLYKGYHSLLEKGLTYFQPITAEDFTPIGSLGFSALEDNIFFTQDEPNFEESTCNAMEADSDQPNKKKIVFFIGNIDDERLVYDIQRLIYDTLNNIYRHKKIRFEFVLEISKYGGSPSDLLKNKILEIESFCKQVLVHEYKNADILFQWA